MEFRHLRYFVAVAEELSFRQAAQRLHLSQPTLTRQVQAWEAELGVRFLERDRRRQVALTVAGAEPAGGRPAGARHGRRGEPARERGGAGSTRPAQRG